MLNVRWGEIHLLGALFVFEPIPEQWITLGESLCTLAALMSLAFYPWVLYIPLRSHASKELLTPLHTFLYIRPVIQSGPRIQLHSKTCNTPIMSRINFSPGIWDNFSKLHHTVYACYIKSCAMIVHDRGLDVKLTQMSSLLSFSCFAHDGWSRERLAGEWSRSFPAWGIPEHPMVASAKHGRLWLGMVGHGNSAGALYDWLCLSLVKENGRALKARHGCVATREKN